jgi:hypothetical protein
MNISKRKWKALLEKCRYYKNYNQRRDKEIARLVKMLIDELSK